MNTSTKVTLFSLLSLCATGVALAQTVLFEDDFSSYPVGSNTNALTNDVSGKWLRASGAPAANFLIAEDPNNPGKHLLWSNGANASPSATPRLTSKTDFQLNEGLRIEFTVNITYTASVEYARVGLVVPKEGTITNWDKTLYLNFYQNQLSIAGYGSYRWGGSNKSFNQGQTYSIAVEFIPKATGVMMSVYMDGDKLLSYLYETGNPDFSFDPDEVYKLYLGFRNDDTNNKAIDAYYGDVRVLAIPEPSSVATLVGLIGLGIALIARRRRCA